MDLGPLAAVFVLVGVGGLCMGSPATAQMKRQPELREDTVYAHEIQAIARDSIRGDLDFSGHGPIMTIVVRRYAEGDEIFWDVSVDAREEGGDGTELGGQGGDHQRVRANWKLVPGATLPLYDPEAVDTLVVRMSGHDPASFRDGRCLAPCDEHIQVQRYVDQGVVAEWKVRGDTKGHDLDATNVVIIPRGVRVAVERPY